MEIGDSYRDDEPEDIQDEHTFLDDVDTDPDSFLRHWQRAQKCYGTDHLGNCSPYAFN